MNLAILKIILEMLVLGCNFYRGNGVFVNYLQTSLKLLNIFSSFSVVIILPLFLLSLFSFFVPLPKCSSF